METTATAGITSTSSVTDDLVTESTDGDAAPGIGDVTIARARYSVLGDPLASTLGTIRVFNDCAYLETAVDTYFVVWPSRNVIVDPVSGRILLGEPANIEVPIDEPLVAGGWILADGPEAELFATDVEGGLLVDELEAESGCEVSDVFLLGSLVPDGSLRHVDLAPDTWPLALRRLSEGPLFGPSVLEGVFQLEGGCLVLVGSDGDIVGVPTWTVPGTVWDEESGVVESWGVQAELGQDVIVVHRPEATDVELSAPASCDQYVRLTVDRIIPHDLADEFRGGQ